MNILLVEDDIDSRNSMAEFIDQLGHRVITCEDGRKALDVLNREKFHLILSDIQMPHLDGHELLKQVKQSGKWKEIVVVLFTGYREVKSAIEALRNGAYDYLLKPIKPEELAVLLDRISEYLTLKEENKKLTYTFNEQVKEATNDIKKELNEIRKAFAREIGTAEIGIFSAALKDIFKTAQKLHKNPDFPVLIEGETGTGKEVIARFIHFGTGDIATPFVGLNCAAISQNLFESELFGYEPGAFTGGNPKGQKGKLQIAQNGTIFLDEITELTPDFQAKLLRVIQERKFYKVGGVKEHSISTRFICATNQDINSRIKNNSFRRDLYFRLNVGHIIIPPLRERKEEILPLTKMFMLRLAREKRTSFTKINSKAVTLLEEYHWPGNVRELKNAIEKISLLHNDNEIKPEYLDFLFHKDTVHMKKNQLTDIVLTSNLPLPKEGIHLNRFILDIVKKALDAHRGNKTRTAKFLGISLRVLHTYIKHLNETT